MICCLFGHRIASLRIANRKPRPSLGKSRGTKNLLPIIDRRQSHSTVPMPLSLGLEGPQSAAEAGFLASQRGWVTVAGQRRTCTGLPPLYPWLPGQGDTSAANDSVVAEGYLNSEHLSNRGRPVRWDSGWRLGWRTVGRIQPIVVTRLQPLPDCSALSLLRSAVQAPRVPFGSQRT